MIIDGINYTWTQPCCETCWLRLDDAREPNRFKEEFRETERCAWCGEDTWSGIYRREDPREVPYPALDDD